MLGGCTLSNSPIVGVHNISETTLVQELEDRQIAVPRKRPGLQIALQAIEAETSGRPSKHRRKTTKSPGGPSFAEREVLQQENMAYVQHLRALLVARLQLEEEYERLTLYLRDTRFDPNVMKIKWKPGRVILDMLHCPMRTNELRRSYTCYTLLQ
jgi:hypothetical protein